MNVLILTADAGGGHRSVARALAAGFHEVGGDRCSVHVVDYLGHYAPFPLSRASEAMSPAGRCATAVSAGGGPSPTTCPLTIRR